MKTICLTGAMLITAAAAFGDATIQEKTQVHVGGAIGAIANVFGGKATHEGMEQTVTVKGDRKSTRTDRNAEIVDLSEEKVYRIDYDRKTYNVVTFDELRKQFEESKARQEKNRNRNEKSETSEGPEYEVDFEVKEPGTKETINGFATRETILIVTVREKGKKLEQSGGFVLTSDMWMGPKVAARSEIASFDRRYFQKVYGKLSTGVDMAQMALLMAQTPAFGKAMKVMSEKRSAFQGTAIRTNLTFDVVGSPEQKEKREDEPASAAGALMGGLMNRMKKKRAESSEGPEHSTLFSFSTEILKAGSTASSDAVAIPGGFTRK